jgi:hypothetical protein
MRNKIKVVVGPVLFLGLISMAHAATPFPDVAIGPIFGTTGVGVQISTPIVPNYLNLTTGYSTFGVNFHITSDGQGYKAKLNLGGIPIYLSVFPFASNFHLDAGIFINQTRFDGLAVPGPNGTYRLNGTDYPAAEVGPLSSETHFDKVAPYLGIGWGNPFIGSNWSFIANAGVILEGGARTRISAPYLQSNPFAQGDIAQAERAYNKSVSVMDAFPVVNLGFTYRF